MRLLDGLDSLTIVLWRSATAFAFLLLLGLAMHGPRLPRAFISMGWAGVLIACCYTAASISLIVALKLTTVAEVLIIMSSSPLLAALLGWLVLGERVGPVGILAMAASSVGIGVMVSDSYAHGSIAGDLVALGIALAQAVAVVTLRRHREVDMLPAMCLATLIATLIVVPLAKPWPLTGQQAGLLGFFGAGQLGLGLALFGAGAPRIPASLASMLNVLEPVIGPIWVWLALGEHPAPMALVGGLIVLAALMLFTAGSLRRLV